MILSLYPIQGDVQAWELAGPRLYRGPVSQGNLILYFCKSPLSCQLSFWQMVCIEPQRVPHFVRPLIGFESLIPGIQMQALFYGNILPFYPRQKKYQNKLKNIPGYEEGKYQLFLTVVL